MTSWGPLRRTPYYFFLAQPSFREQRLCSYIRRAHRAGRSLDEILDDPYVQRHGPSDLVWQTFRDTRLIELIGKDMCDTFERARQAVADGPASSTA